MHEAGRRDPLAIFHEAIERTTHRHQAFRLIGPGIGDRPRIDSMRDVMPQRLATMFQPQVEGVQALGTIGRAWCRERVSQYVWMQVCCGSLKKKSRQGCNITITS